MQKAEPGVIDFSSVKFDDKQALRREICRILNYFHADHFSVEIVARPDCYLIILTRDTFFFDTRAFRAHIVDCNHSILDFGVSNSNKKTNLYFKIKIQSH